MCVSDTVSWYVRSTSKRALFDNGCYINGRYMVSNLFSFGIDYYVVFIAIYIWIMLNC